MNPAKGALAVFAILLAASLLSGCIAGNPPNSAVPPVPTAKSGDLVQVDYTLYLSNGNVFDTSMAADAAAANLTVGHPFGPLNLTIGDGMFLPAFENALVGMKAGDSKTITLTPQQGYGERNPALVINVSVQGLQASGITPLIGTKVSLQNGAGQGVITNITNGTAYIDFNSPLAGQTLTFKLILRSIGGLQANQSS